MASHLLAISDKKWRYAFYVAPDEAKKRALKIIFDSIASVIVKTSMCNWRQNTATSSAFTPSMN